MFIYTGGVTLNISILIKKIYSYIIFHSGIFKFQTLNYLKNRQYCILMYHRITQASDSVQAGMYVEPLTFESHIELLNEYFNIISLNELLKIIEHRNFSVRDKPYCIITFDDGWKDFYDNAYPVLRKYNTPATVFLPTDFIGTTNRFWTDDLSYLLRHKKPVSGEHPTLDNHQEIEYLSSIDGDFEHKLEAGIEYLKKLPLIRIKKILYEMAKIWEVDFDSQERSFLDWSEVAELLESRLISFGSHTEQHQILTTIDEDAIKNELHNSLVELEKRKVINSSCKTFCYPNGNHNKKIAEMVRLKGYHLAVTTHMGWNHTNKDIYRLNRIGIHQDIASTKELYANRIAGNI
jgi:peptidoglycan/xylan/chitin deacetylase (PgdA/CDA1 family)